MLTEKNNADNMNISDLYSFGRTIQLVLELRKAETKSY